MIAKKKRVLVAGIIIIVMILAIYVAIAYKEQNETDFVFEGTFVSNQASTEEVFAEKDTSFQDGNRNHDEKGDCFKRKLGDCVFI